MPSGVYVASVEGMVTDDVFAVIAEATRRDILIALRKGDKAVGELVQELEASQPTISKHLKVLREADLVSMRAQGQKRYYTLNPKPLAGIATWLQAFDVGPAATADAAAALHPEAGPAAVPEGLAAAVPQPAWRGQADLPAWLRLPGRVQRLVQPGRAGIRRSLPHAAKLSGCSAWNL